MLSDGVVDNQKYQFLYLRNTNFLGKTNDRFDTVTVN